MVKSVCEIGHTPSTTLLGTRCACKWKAREALQWRCLGHFVQSSISLNYFSMQPFLHVTFTNTLRNQGSSEHSVGNADLKRFLLSLELHKPLWTAAFRSINKTLKSIFVTVYDTSLVLFLTMASLMRSPVFHGVGLCHWYGGGEASQPWAPWMISGDSLARSGGASPTPTLTLTGWRVTASTHESWELQLLHELEMGVVHPLNSSPLKLLISQKVH